MSDIHGKHFWSDELVAYLVFAIISALCIRACRPTAAKTRFGSVRSVTASSAAKSPSTARTSDESCTVDDHSQR